MAFLQRSSRRSDDSSSFIGTIRSTSSSSTVPGPGAIAGKFLKVLGEKSLDLVVFVIVRNRLRAIERTLEKSPHVFRTPTGDKEQKRLNDAYGDLREICLEARSDYHPLSFQRAAAKLIHDITMMRRPVEQSVTIDAEASLGQSWETLLVNVQHLLPPQGLEPQGLEEPRDRTPKVLVLGAGDVGKSTFVKQILRTSSMRHDAETYRNAIIKDTIVSLLDIVSDLNPSDLSEDCRNTFQQTKDAVQHILDHGHISDHAQEIGGAIWLLWNDPAVRRAVHRSKLGMLSGPGFESIEYFLESTNRIFNSDYAPTHEDIVRCRIRTLGLWEIELMFPEQEMSPWVLIDTGGQRSERKKWKHCFENVTAIIFVVALSDYNRTLSEDPNVNRMEDSLALFESIANTRCFTNTLIVLLFNKFDLFMEKLPIEPLEVYFPDYMGHDVDDACKYFERRFLSVVEDKTKPVVVEYGTAIEEEEVLGNEVNQHHERNIDIPWKDSETHLKLLR